MNESAVQSLVRERFGFIGPMWRNNSGAMEDKTGRVVRFGLGNDSAALNREIKSSDLIGGTPVLIRPHHVGHVFLNFTALECKRLGWSLRPNDKHAQAQLRYMEIVRNHGGFADFITHPSQIEHIIGRRK